MKLKKMTMLIVLSLFIAGCEAGFDDMINDANKADAALQSVTVKNSSTSADIGFNFSRGVTSYTINAGSGTESVNISAIPVKADSILEYRVDGSTWLEMNGAKNVSGLASVDSKKIEIRVTSSKGDSVVYSFNVSGKYIKVIYSANGATGGTVPVDYNNYCFNDSVNVFGNTGNLIKAPAVGSGEAFKFGGWNTKADGSGTVYAGTGAFQITEDTILYVKWVEFELRDRGSANGWIFYDKGSYSDGWRYLEAYTEDVVITGWNNAMSVIGSYPPYDWYIGTVTEMEYLFTNLVQYDTIGSDVSNTYKFWVNSYASAIVSYPASCYFVRFYGEFPYSPSFSATGIGNANSNNLRYRAIRKF